MPYVPPTAVGAEVAAARTHERGPRVVTARYQCIYMFWGSDVVLFPKTSRAGCLGGKVEHTNGKRTADCCHMYTSM